MALQLVHHFLFFIFLFTLILISPILGHAKREMMPISDKKPPHFAFDFINQLEGSKKGNKIEGIHKIKNYLHQFGYLDNQNLNLNHAAEPHDDEFNDALESAIKTYQRNYHIAPTGILDATTVSKMATPRCGYADIINGINTMQPNKGKKYSNSNNDIHTVSHYRFTVPRNRRWPRSKANLTYQFLPNTPEIAVDPVSRAFQKWHSVSGFSFSRAQDSSSTDLVIGFFNRSHGDGYPFDGPGGVTAHAFRPTDGRLHYDADEKWSDGPAPDAMDLESIAVHEIGHLLGLGHSDVEAAIMYSYLNYGMNKTNFDADDINGIKSLYRNWGN
ncbi:hypothetical protein ABFX02_10G116200 [Erythranthe guttata]